VRLIVDPTADDAMLLVPGREQHSQLDSTHLSNGEDEEGECSFLFTEKNTQANFRKKRGK